MTPEEQIVAIAEACGWTDIKRGPYDGLPFGRYKTHQLEGVPDYLADLNAMHEAEKVLIGDEPENSELWCDFQTNLVIACPAYLSYHATAAQRAEAFLRTIGKWKECK